jgi:hypothetical protein
MKEKIESRKQYCKQEAFTVFVLPCPALEEGCRESGCMI